MRSPRAFVASLAILALAAIAAPAAADTFSYSSDDDFHYAYIEPGDEGGVRVMSGDWGKATILDELAEDGGPLLWFEKDGREYVVRDSRLVDRARTATQPMIEIGKQQGRLGAKQGALGARQGELGGRMGELGARLGEISSRLAMARLTDNDADDLSEERASIQREMRELSQAQRPLSQKQRELGRQQAALGRQEAADDQQAGAEMRRIFDDALRSGAAERVAHTRLTIPTPSWIM